MIDVADRIRLEHVFVVGHEAHHPVVSNARPIDKARYRRVEIVVYPESYQQ